MTTETEERMRPDEPYYRRGDQARRWGALLLLIGLVWLVFALISRVPFTGFGGGTVERSVSVPPERFTATRIVVTGVHDTLHIVPGADAVQLTATKYGYGRNATAANAAAERLELQAVQRGDTLTIEVRREPSFGQIIGRTPYVALELAVPAGATVEASITSGDVAITEFTGNAVLTLVSGNAEIDAMRGDLRVNTTSGDLEVDDFSGALAATSVSGTIQVSGNLREAAIGTTSGDVSLEGVRGPISVTTISGSLRIDDAEATQLQLETTSGDVRFAGAIERDGRISTISGDVEVRLAADAALRLAARTLSGDFDVADDLGTLEQERRQLSGVIGDGGPLLEISTSSGDIRIKQ